MPIDTAFDYFLREELAGFADVLTPEMLAQWPLLRWFQRVVHDGYEVEVRVGNPQATIAPVTDWNKPSPLAPGEDGRIIRATPVPIREMVAMDNREMSFFAQWEELVKKVGRDNVPESFISRRDKILMKKLRYLIRRKNERLHQLCSKALQGTLEFTYEGKAISESYGLDSIAAPSTLFTDTGAKIIEEFYRAFADFEYGASGVTGANTTPDLVIISSEFWARKVVPNEEFKTWVRSNPEFTRQFLQGGSIANPRAPFEFLGRTFQTVGGSYKDDTGISYDRWPSNLVTMLAVNVPGEEPNLEHASVRDAYCPDGQENWRQLAQQNPIALGIECADNIVPMINVRERVKTWQIAA